MLNITGSSEHRSLEKKLILAPLCPQFLPDQWVNILRNRINLLTPVALGIDLGDGVLRAALEMSGDSFGDAHAFLL